jgi:hypothetical protein
MRIGTWTACAVASWFATLPSSLSWIWGESSCWAVVAPVELCTVSMSMRWRSACANWLNQLAVLVGELRSGAAIRVPATAAHASQSC